MRAGTGAFTAVLLGAALAAPGSAWGQGTVEGATFHAVVGEAAGGEGAVVEVVYRIAGVSGTASVPVSVLDFGDAAATAFLVGAGEMPVHVPPTVGVARGAAFPVEAGVDGVAVLRVRYSVPVSAGKGGAATIHLPVLTVDLPPTEARPGLFQGIVEVPEGWTVSEGFPTGMVPGAEAGTLAVELQVVPSVVTLRVRTDGSRGLGLPLLLDTVAVAGLLLFSLAGWRFLTRTSA